MYFQNENQLMHYGTKRKSGRYPWGSGERPYQSGGPRFFRKAKKKELQKRITTDVAKKATKLSSRQIRKDERARKKQIAIARKQIEAEKEEAKLAEERQKKKEEAIRKGDVKELSKYIYDMSNDELKAVTERLKNINFFTTEASKRADAGYKSVKKALDKVGDIGDFSEKFAKFFTSANNIKKVMDDWEKAKNKGSSSNGKK